MDDGLEALTVAEIMTRVRDKVRRAAVPTSAVPAGNGFASTLERRADRATLESQWDIYEVDVRSPRVGLGVLLTSLKKALRRLLAPTLGRQILYNAANTRVTLALSDQVDLIGRHQARVSEEILARLSAQDAAIRELRDAVSRYESELRTVRDGAARAGDGGHRPSADDPSVADRRPGDRAATDPVGTDPHAPCRRA